MAWAVAQAMFVSAHDLSVLTVVLVAAGVAGTGSALLLGRRVQRASRALVDVARRIGAGDVTAAGGKALPTTELAALARELDHMSVALERARRRERTLEGSRRELVAWVSHDLRSPLAAIRAMAEALEDGVVSDPETVARYHHQLVFEVDRLAGLVDDLFELSRTQAGVLQLQLERVSLSDLVSDALAGAVPVAEAKGVRLEGQLQGASPDLDLSTPEVARALRNLLENAIRHTPSDGTVVVQAGVVGEAAYVSVTDTCGGIPDVDLDRVFDVAFRGETARTPGAGAGAGLGLAIARAMVDAGADMFVGHGPHVLRGVEIYNGKPIFYSLGDFIFQNETLLRLPAENYEPFDLGASAHVNDFNDARYNFDKSGFPADPLIWEAAVAVPRFRGEQLTELALHPITLGFGKSRSVRGRPMAAEGALGQKILEDLVRLSAPMGTKITIRNGVGYVNLGTPATRQ
jgi:signal transduction histidine kinase